MRVQKALIDDTITVKKAGLLLYSLQLAAMNVGQTTFGEAGDRDLVTELVDEEEALNNQFSAVSLEQTLFTAENAESAKESQILLPQINADKRLPEMPKLPKIAEIEKQDQTMRM